MAFLSKYLNFQPNNEIFDEKRLIINNKYNSRLFNKNESAQQKIVGFSCELNKKKFAIISRLKNNSFNKY